MHWANVIYNGQQLTKLFCVARETVTQSYILDIFVVLLLISIHIYAGCNCNVIIKLRILCFFSHYTVKLMPTRACLRPVI